MLTFFFCLAKTNSKACTIAKMKFPEHIKGGRNPQPTAQKLVYMHNRKQKFPEHLKQGKNPQPTGCNNPFTSSTYSKGAWLSWSASRVWCAGNTAGSPWVSQIVRSCNCSPPDKQPHLHSMGLGTACLGTAIDKATGERWLPSLHTTICQGFQASGGRRDYCIPVFAIITCIFA